jgi:streptomycin 6-kinase
MKLTVPAALAENCREPFQRAWLRRLPACVHTLAERWSLELHEPFSGATCAWVAPVTRADQSRAVLKVGMPHLEAEHEIQGLRFWQLGPMVHLIDAVTELDAMLLEACQPGTPLRSLPEPEQDVVLSGLLRRLWSTPPLGAFRPLSDMVEYWAACTLADSRKWRDSGLVRSGLEVFRNLSHSGERSSLLLTDLHAGNVLRAEREPWLAIDPKPFVGDVAYDATQHLLNCQSRMVVDADGAIKRFAELLDVSSERVRLWCFARLAAAPRDDWRPSPWDLVVPVLSP